MREILDFIVDEDTGVIEVFSIDDWDFVGCLATIEKEDEIGYVPYFISQSQVKIDSDCLRCLADKLDELNEHA